MTRVITHDLANDNITAGDDRKRRLPLGHWIPIAVFGCAFLFLVATMRREVNVYDEGLILFGSTRVLSGDVPYRDFFANYGPAQFYVLAALFKFFGPSVLVERIWDVLIRACTVLTIYLVVDDTWSRGKAIFVAALTCLWLSYFGSYGYPVFPCLLFSLLSSYCMMRVFRGCRAFVPLLASGVCVGITILFRHDVGIAAGIAGAFTLAFFQMAQKPDALRKSKLGALLRLAAPYLGGIALSLVVPLALLLAAGSAHAMLVDLILIPATTYVPMASLPFPSVFAIAWEIKHLEFGSLHQLAIYLPIPAVLVGAMAELAAARNQRSRTSAKEQALVSQRRWTLMLLSLFTLLFFFKGWVRVSLIHMALSIVPALVIMAVWQPRSRVAMTLFGVGIAWVLLISSVPIRYAFRQFEQNRAWVADGIVLPKSVSGLTAPDGGSCFPPAGLERLRCFYVPQQQLAAIRYVQEHTTEDEAIFVGLTRHDKIFVNNILFYFLSKRHSVTKWHMFAAGVQTTEKVQSEIVGEFQTRRPRYVVLSSEWDSVKEPNESARSSGTTVLDEFIRANYRPVRGFGPTLIFESRW